MELINLVVGPSNPVDFVEDGKAVAHQGIVNALQKHGLQLNDFRAILDFGCGCGRLMRHWKPLTGPRLYGADYNPLLIDWCRHNLPFAEFTLNQLEPPLSYPDQQFDFVFAGSTFTHFSEELQFGWLDELWRVMMPGGYLLMTLHGDYYAERLPPRLKALYRAGRFVAVNERRAGTNRCGAYHSERYIRTALTGRFQLVDLIPQGWDTQDIALFRRPVTQPVGIERG